MRWRRACLSFKWKWPSKIAFMSCTVVVVQSTYYAFYCGYIFHTMHCVIYTRQKTWQNCEKKHPIHDNLCVHVFILLFRSFLFGIVLVFVIAGSIDVYAIIKSKEGKAVYKLIRRKKEKVNVNACLYHIKSTFSTGVFFTIHSSAWSACYWIHLSHRVCEMRQENKSQSWENEMRNTTSTNCEYVETRENYTLKIF